MKVLFVCVGNSCRSQMAEALARHYGLDAASAGTRPATGVSPHAIEVIEELGIDMTGYAPKVLRFEELSGYDRVVTMGCGVAASCPSLQTDEDWGLDDPVGQPVAAFRKTRDAIDRHLRELMLHHGIEPPASPIPAASPGTD